MSRKDNAAITAQTMAIAPLAPSFAQTARLELRAALDGPAARAGSKAHPGERGVARHGAAGEWSGDSR